MLGSQKNMVFYLPYENKWVRIFFLFFLSAVSLGLPGLFKLPSIILLLLLLGLNKVLVVGPADRSIFSVWRIYIFPIRPRRWIESGAIGIEIDSYVETEDDYTYVYYKVGAFGKKRKKASRIVDYRKYEHANALARRLAIALNVPLTEKLFSGKVTLPQDIDKSLVDIPPASASKVTTPELPKKWSVSTSGNITRIQLPSQPHSRIGLVFYFTMIGLFALFLRVLSGTWWSGLMVYWLVIPILLDYYKALFPLVVEISGIGLRVKKAYKERYFFYESLIDIAVKPNRLILVTHHSYYVIPHRIQKPKAKMVRDLILSKIAEVSKKTAD